jgi:hypothetical protein
VLAAADGGVREDLVWWAAAGIEYDFRKWFALRGGYRLGTDTAGLSAGAGASVPVGKTRIGADYAFLQHEALGATHRAALRLEF